MRSDQRWRQLFQIKLQAARQNGDRDFLRIGGRQYELHMRGRLFQRLQHRIEGGLRQHVDFVDDIHLETRIARRIQRALQQFAHIVDLGVGRGIQLDQIDETPAVNFTASAALAAGRRGNARQTVKRLGEDARDRGLAHPARAGKEIGVVQAILCQRIGKRSHDMLLPRQLREVFGPPFAC